MALSLTPPRLPRTKRNKAFLREAEVRPAVPTGSRSRPWPQPPPTRRYEEDEAESSISAAVISTAEAEVFTSSHRMERMDRPAISLGAGLVASALLALGILMGVVLTVVGRGEADPLYEKAAALVDPSESTGSAAAAPPAAAPLPPPFPVQPPVAAAALPARPASVFMPVVIGHPARDGVSPVSVDAPPRAGSRAMTTKAAAAPRTSTTRKAPPAVSQTASAISTPPPAAKPAPRSPSGDADLDAAKQANLRAKAATADSL